MELSIVTTLYYSALDLNEFYTRIKQEAERITNDYEIILVNDGSPDDALDIAISLHEKDPHVTVIDLSRNFGHHKGMMTGLAHAKGELVFLIDCDLEEPPELLGEIYSAFQASDADVIYGVQPTRKGSWFERVSGTLFYMLFNLLSDHKIPANVLVARLMTKRYVASLVAHKESELLIGGLWQITGFKQIPTEVQKHEMSRTTYNLRRKLSLVVKAVTAFSSRPLFYIAYLGAVMLGISVLYILYLVAVRLFFGQPPSGFTALIVSVWFLGGLIMFSLGVIAIYVSVIFVETKNRPYSIIRHIYERDGSKT